MSIFIIFISALFVQQIYHLFVFSRIAFYKSVPTGTKALPAVSLIVCCKNERSNIEKHLPFLLSQQYPAFEILVMDDDSNDGTFEYMEEMKLSFPLHEIRCIRVQKKIAGKKEVLFEGVKAAKYEFVLVTDADCKPSSNQWIRQMAEALNSETAIVIGYAPFNVLAGNAVNLLSRFENFITACFYFSFAIARIPYMGVGRNMLFRKNLYLEAFDRIIETGTLSGDDDLFIQYAANRENCEVCIDSDTFLYSDAKTNWRDFFQQKARHISTGFHYKKSYLLILSMYPLTMLLFISAYLRMFFCKDNDFIFATVVLSIYFLMIWQLKKRAAAILHFNSQMPILIMDIFFLLYQIILVILPFKRKKARWQENKNNRNELKMTQN